MFAPGFLKILNLKQMKFKRGKKIMVYGVEMTSLENMLFDKYISTSGIAMNTKNREERFQITNDWLKNQ